MSWNQEQFLKKLKEAVDAFDTEGTAALCQELIERLGDETGLQPGIARKVLATLRRKCYFDLMEKVADALRDAELDDVQVRRQYAQSLIDQAKIPAAAYVLELLVERTADDPEENAEARGLLGRIHKQLYVNAVNADPKALEKRLNRRNLQRAVSAYHEVYRSDEARHLWHGINTVALTLRAEKDGVELESAPDARRIAREILDLLEANKKAREAEDKSLDSWDLATAMEASVALGDAEQAQIWLGRYVQHEGADAFELQSTERQLREVWRLTLDDPLGSLLLPVLQAAALKRRFGRVELAAPQVDQTIRETVRLEKTFGKEGVVSLAWYRQGLERCRGVAQIKNEVGDGLGTGFLLRGSDLEPALGDGLLLLTNAHVVSDDPKVQEDKKALPPDEAVAFFEALETEAGKPFRVELLWTSPPGELDATLLRLDRPVEDPPEVFPIAKRLPAKDGQQKVYVIGHPLGGGLSISLTDNALLGYDDRLLHYRAPTEGGSSGSPVFNNQWKLIGLHHAGGYGLERLDGQPGTYDANEGIQIRRIIEAVQEAKIASAPGSGG